MTRRKQKNVIVTGLPEPLECSEEQHGLTDEDGFNQLCEEHLLLKPALDRKGCIRVGRTENRRDRPRRLLVHLISETSALLAAAKQLRKSDDPVIARRVYINHDLSPTEAKLAYKRRQRKRATAARRNNQGSTNMVNHDICVTESPQNSRKSDTMSNMNISTSPAGDNHTSLNTVSTFLRN